MPPELPRTLEDILGRDIRRWYMPLKGKVPQVAEWRRTGPVSEDKLAWMPGLGANFGLRTGSKSGTVAVEVGAGGSWTGPATLIVRFGSDRYFLYKYASGVKPTGTQLAPHVTVQAEGGFIPAGPSSTQLWTIEVEHPIAECPPVLLDRRATPKAPESAARDANVLLEAALSYAARGWHVLPIHSPGAGTSPCSCGNPKCDSPAKHPRTSHGVKDATTDPTQVREWWARWPDANVGIATGRVSGFFALDVDPRHGGDESLAKWEGEHGPLPLTCTVRTGGGGRHFYFLMPSDGSTLKNRIGMYPGIDIRADGGYVLAPPSIHTSRGTYAEGADQ